MLDHGPDESNRDIPPATPSDAPAVMTAVPQRHGRAMGMFRLILAFLCVEFGIVFTLQNTDSVTVAFLVWALTLSRALLVFLLIVVGTVLGWLLRSMFDADGFRPLG